MNRGVIHSMGHDDAAAMADFDEAIRIDPPMGEACNNRGWVLSQQGHFEQAIANDTKALDRDPSFAPARKKLWELGVRTL